MDKWIAAFTALGGLTAVGGLIDLAMYKAEKDKLKAFLEDWWLRFTDVKWSNFGRAEAELAVQILDRWAGPRLWSLKRWRLSTVVTLVVLVFAITWTVVRIGTDVVGTTYSIKFLLFMLPPSIVALALSLSVTRFIAVSAAQLCKGRLASVAVFTALLSLHVLLLLYWGAIVLGLEVMPMQLLLNAEFYNDWSANMESLLDEAMPHSSFWPDSWRYLFSFHPGHASVEIYSYSFKVAMDIVANGLRIVFALVFLSSFVFRPLIQEPITRLWYGAMNSKKPIFTMLFGAVGALIAAGQVLAK